MKKKQSSGRALFWTQLATLVWKNLTLRKRNRLFALLELISPLVLFLIIVFVRFKRPPIDKPACHLQPKALPSAGFFPFIKTFVCSINNDCSSYPPEANPENSQFEQLVTSYTLLLGDDDFTETIEWVLDSNVESLLQPGGMFNLEDNRYGFSNTTFEALETSQLNLAGYLFQQSGDSNIAMDPDSVINAALAPFRSFELCDEEGSLNEAINLQQSFNRSQVAEEVCSLGNRKRETLLKPLTDITGYFGTPQALLRIFRLFSALDKYGTVELTTNALNTIQTASQSYFQNGTQSGPAVPGTNFQADILSTVVSFTCGPTSATAGLLSLGSVQDVAEGLGVTFKQNDYKKDPEFSDACNSLFELLESNVVSRTLWNFVKPVFIGKIFYSPDTVATAKVMSVMNETFEQIDELFQILTLVESSRDLIFRQLYDYFEDPESNDFPLLDTIIATVPAFFNFEQSLNETAQDFFSNSNDSLYNWQDLFNATFDVFEMITEYVDCIPTNRLEAFASEPDLIRAGNDLLKKGKVWAGIVFTNIEEDEADDLPHHVKYKIRMNTERVDSTRRIIDRVWFPDPRVSYIIDLKPYTSGQIFIMDLLEKAIIKVQSKESKHFVQTGTWLKQFPSPCYKEDQFLYAISRTIPLFMTLAWLFSVGMIVKGIVYEKETRLKEVMKIMGLGNSILWISWFITTFILMCLASILLSIILKVGTVLSNSNLLLIMLMFISFTLPTITFCFLVSTLFSKANLASACAGIAFFCFYLPYTLYLTWEQYITSNVVKYAMCLCSNVAFGFACSYFAYFEQQGTGVQWDNINTSPNYKDNFSLSQVILMMYLDAIIYLLLALYIEQVFPGTYGIPKKWYFFLQKSFWYGDESRALISNDFQFDPDFTVKGDRFEAEPLNERIGVQIRSMTKVYPTGNKLAVDKLSVNFYENQITSFLGHNGAGKTTTLSIITGLFAPTEGTAFVNGMDIRRNMDEIRRSVGMCPQYNVLFDYLTVSEHLYFYGKLRGRNQYEIEKDTAQLLTDLNLPHKSNEYSKNLSGGMKRKLSVAVSFVGGNRTVILDEPTAGVDPFSRRGIWELLSKYKRGRTIILSTHHMDEADVLGDRIAIIANGQLQCSGSSLFLRRHFGDGYMLTVAKRQNHFSIDSNSEHSLTPNGSEKCDQNICDFVQAQFEGAALLKNLGQEMTFVLPYSGLEQGSFNSLFEQLELNVDRLGISEYGLSDTSLEEIFIKVADQAPDNNEEGDGGMVPRTRRSFRRKNAYELTGKKTEDGWENDTDNENDNGEPSANVVEYGVVNGDVKSSGQQSEVVVKFRKANRSGAKTFAQLNVPKVHGVRLLWLQFCALYIKRFHHLRKDRKAFFTQILLPACFVFLAMFSSMVLPDPVDQPSLELQPWMYGDNHWMFYSDSSANNERVQRTIDEFLVEKPHHSTRCVFGYEIDGHACKPNLESATFSDEISDSVLNTYDPSSNNPSPPCSCDSGNNVCEAFAGGPTPAEKRLSTTDRLQDLTDRNLSDYLMKTRLDFRLQRFYGFEFEGDQSDFNLTQNDLVRTADRVYDFLISGGYLDGSVSYSNGLSWKAVIDELIVLLNSSIAPNNVKVWWNNKAHHGMLSSVNAMHNILLRSSLPESMSNSEKYTFGISAFSHPWSLTLDQLEDAVLIRSGRDLVIGICVIFAMSFVPASFILYLIDERVSKSKHLQYVSGVNPAVFWLSTAAWDFTNYLFPSIICILIFLAFQAESYVSGANFPCLCLLLILYGMSVTPLMYPACYLFSIPSTAYVLLTGLNAFIGINATTATYILDFFPNDKTLSDVNQVLKQVFLLFPQYCLGRGLFEMALNQLFADQLGQYGEYEFRSPLQFDIAGKHLLAMSIQSVVMFTLLLCVEHVYVFRRLIVNRCHGSEMRAQLNRQSSEGDEDIEDDVNNETRRILSGGASTDPVVVKRLRKEYSTNIHSRKKFAAVKDLTFAVPNGQCFGLLGVNGAGKTTTFNILTGDDVATSGQALIGGHDIVTDLNNARKKVGFCPQFDALDSLLTVREHMALYARLRGIQNADVAAVTDGCIEKMGLIKYRDKQAGTLSGGNKRKLSTAIALVGDPQIIFLDEPTSGMDPKARRYLWQCIHDAVSEGRSVVLTSHSMEECEALCTRLAIMVNGQFRCLGSSQHIKTKYGDGYVIQIKVPSTCCDQMEQFFTSHFPDAQITEKLPTLVVFQLGQQHAKLGDMFRVIEMGKKTKVQVPQESLARDAVALVEVALVEDFSVSQTTLDQVFINFAKDQSDEKDESRKSKNSLSRFAKLKRARERNAQAIVMESNGQSKKNYWKSLPETGAAISKSLMTDLDVETAVSSPQYLPVSNEASNVKTKQDEDESDVGLSDFAQKKKDVEITDVAVDEMLSKVKVQSIDEAGSNNEETSAGSTSGDLKSTAEESLDDVATDLSRSMWERASVSTNAGEQHERDANPLIGKENNAA